MILPKETSLLVYAFGLHRDPKIYPDPDRFDPERFTQEKQASRSPYAYLPFSAGPRNCIGKLLHIWNYLEQSVLYLTPFI